MEGESIELDNCYDIKPLCDLDVIMDSRGGGGYRGGICVTVGALTDTNSLPNGWPHSACPPRRSLTEKGGVDVTPGPTPFRSELHRFLYLFCAYRSE